MLRKYGIPFFALLGVVVAIVVVVVSSRAPAVPPITFPPPKPPYIHFVAGSGIIEASSENISIGTAISGVVERVFVAPGAMVKRGDPLYQVDTRNIYANKLEATASKEVALASFNRLINEPRTEEIPPLEARVRQAEIHLADEYSQYNLFQNVSDKRAISFNDFNQRKYAARLAKYELDQASADLALLKAGGWIEDVKISSRQIEEAESRINAADVELERTIARAPMDGQVLQVNIHPGEFAGGGAADTLISDQLMLFGTIDPLHIRVDVDEDDAWRIFQGSSATAFLRGNSDIKIPLKFVYIEPYVIPKRSLTGDNLERVDTRVLQLIYRFERDDLPVYLGQLVDVYIESKPSRGL
ncbi:MAG: p-hydroxybenzoic acid efflux pump subunit AaeA [Chlamydiae bacterium]|nr:p-hydroxybenzoic acid efflux pump subunit AaeA [Chlamydiota bacterium]